MIEALGYARVSRQEQATDRNGLQTQVNRLKRAGCTEIFSDIETGRKWGEKSRTDFQAILTHIRDRTVKQIVVTAIDRLSRDSITSWQLLEEIERSQIPILVLDTGRVINFADPNEWYESRQAGLRAEHESRQISKRSRDGYQNLRNSRKANPRIPFGYKRVDEQYELDLDKYDCARETIELYLELKHLPKVTRIIYEKYGHAWSVSGLRYWLINPVLVGHTPYGKRQPISPTHAQGEQIIWNTHSDRALMTEQTQEEIRSILVENVRIWGKNTTAWRNPLAGLVVCQECGYSCDILSKPCGGKLTPLHRVRYYYCRTRSKKPAGRTCGQSATYRYETIEAALQQALIDRAVEICELAIAPIPDVEPLELRELRGQLGALQSLGDNPAIAQAIKDLQDQIANFQNRSLLDNEKAIADRQLLLETYGDSDYWKTLSDEDKRKIYSKLVLRILVSDREIVEIALRV